MQATAGGLFGAARGRPGRLAWLACAAVMAGLVSPGCGAPTTRAFDRAADPLQRWIPLPEGTTPLESIGLYRIAYQRYGHDAVDMPVSWAGDFTEDSGIALVVDRLGGRPAMLLHCPWRGETGAAFVEYRLAIPRDKPIRLALAIAMRPDVVGKSDGVTFSASVTYGGKVRELMREHYAAAEPKAMEFDLSQYAGKEAVLRLQTEPGPAKNAGFDFSYFIEPRIVVGRAGGGGGTLVEEMTATRAYRAGRQADLKRLANRPGEGLAPSCKFDFPRRAGVRKLGDSAELVYEGPDCGIVYRYTPRTGTLDDLLVSADGRTPFRPCSQGGVVLAGKAAAGTAPSAKLLGFDVTDKAAVADWKYTLGDASATVKWTFAIRGKALVISAESSDATIATFSLGRPLSDFRRSVAIPYLYPGAVDFLLDQKLFCLAWLDWTQSHASHSSGAESVYVAKQDHKRNALREVGYVAVSGDLDEVLPNIPHPPSEYLKLLAPKVMLDAWGGRFADLAAMLEDYKSRGIDELAIILHDWQRYGYDVKLPDHLPPNPDLGGDAGMKLLADTARKLGYVFSVHENYIDFYPDAPSWNPKDVARDPNGEMQKAWYQPGTKVQSFAIKANRMLHYAERNSPEIHRRYGTTAAYLDVHTCVPPWHHVDYESGEPLAGMYASKVKHHAELFAFERRTHAGPLFGEGADHFYWAGLADGVEAQVRGGEDAPVLVDFDLLKLHPQMVNHGMGYYTRWLRTGRESRHGVDWPTPEQLDKYRAQELAYGHAGFLGSGVLDALPLVVREYNLVQPVQACYGDAKVVEISYEVGGRLVSGSVAAVAGVLDRLRIAYDSGLTLHVNLGPKDWQVGGVVLPQYGFLADGPGVRAWTARVDGVIADYARTKERLYVDARTDVYKPWASGVRDVEPRLKEFKDLGGGKFQVTYEWAVGQTMPGELHCFVHFCGPADDDGEGIVFQNDHATPRPTGEWKPGTVLIDGPHTVQVPDDAKGDRFDILVGLYSRTLGRAALKGLQTGQQRVLIGRLAVTRKDGRIDKLQLADLAGVREAYRRSREPFLKRMNVEGRRVSFGPAATDGAFQIRVEKGRLELLPYPRDRKFQVELDLPRLTGKGRVAEAKVTALDKGGEALSAVPASLEAGKLTFEAGLKGAVQFRIDYE